MMGDNFWMKIYDDRVDICGMSGGVFNSFPLDNSNRSSCPKIQTIEQTIGEAALLCHHRKWSISKITDHRKGD